MKCELRKVSIMKNENNKGKTVGPRSIVIRKSTFDGNRQREDNASENYKKRKIIRYTKFFATYEIL